MRRHNGILLVLALFFAVATGSAHPWWGEKAAEATANSTAIHPGDASTQGADSEPVGLAVIGLSHDHVHWIFGRDDLDEVQLLAIYEPDPDLQERYADQYGLDRSLFHEDLESMLDEVEPEAVTAFNSTYEHLELVRAAAPRGIDVMVEKPLAVSLEHAEEMEALALEHDIHLLTNYETTWYATKPAAYDMVHHKEVTGDLRKMIFRHGHQGPKEIGVSEEFLDWLTDPVLNGGGAIMDFGCYGANLATWYHKGEEPLSVTATTQQIKPHIYEEVDDAATIILNYPDSHAIIQASWNWAYNRKDMHLYGVHGFIHTIDDQRMEWMQEEGEPVQEERLESREAPFDDPFRYFAAVVRGEIDVEERDLSSLANNMTVMRILDAAIESAESGRTIYLNER